MLLVTGSALHRAENEEVSCSFLPRLKVNATLCQAKGWSLLDTRMDDESAHDLRPVFLLEDQTAMLGYFIPVPITAAIPVYNSFGKVSIKLGADLCRFRTVIHNPKRTLSEFCCIFMICRRQSLDGGLRGKAAATLLAREAAASLKRLP